ncbi:unnamed protein product [Mesocestoides corti]|uniref:Transposase n=1 Tax=Mesocestoides corti TaxID=53468 RepID=A0A0R3U8T6_MESCO|nr:unnamed protein product [Mesocestoides corti]
METISPIAVNHADYAAHYTLLLSRVLLLLATYLPRMPVKLRQTQDWLIQVIQYALIRCHTASSSGVKLSSASGLVHRTVQGSTLPDTPHLADPFAVAVQLDTTVQVVVAELPMPLQMQ